MKKLHAFVAMPFGKKTVAEETVIGFNADYKKQLNPATENADLVVVNLPLEPPNAWYESGVPHTLQSRSTVPFQGPRAKQPFDIYTDRKQNYSLHNGLSNPATLKKNQAALTKMLKATQAFWHDRKNTNRIRYILAVNAYSP